MSSKLKRNVSFQPKIVLPASPVYFLWRWRS